MSVFKVRLQTIEQGLLDRDPTTHPLSLDGSPSGTAVFGNLGEPFGDPFPNSGPVSLQRQMFVTGPNRTYRLLRDGETFTDCNYWKRFAFPQVTEEFAFIEVVTDDGSVFSDIESENTFAVGSSGSATTDPAATVIDFVNDNGGAALFLQVTNADSTNDLIGELNGDVTVTFTLAPGETQVFNQGDLAITLVRLKSNTGTTDYNLIASVRSVCQS